MATPVIRVEKLTKYYGKRRGVEDVSFDVEPGEVFGFLGPNGAGKTTTMRVILDLLRPTSGRVEVFGLDARNEAPKIHARVGYLPGEMPAAERLNARDQLAYSANLRGIGKEPIAELAARFELDLAKTVRSMSSGNKRKVGVVQAFMHDPELLILDEPTGGLDPLMQQEFNELVRERRAAGRTVFLSSHILHEVEALCDRVGIIRDGRLVAIEEVAALKEKAVRRARIRFASRADASALEGVPGVTEIHAENGVLTCVVRGPTGPLVKALAKLDVVDLSLKEPTLEEAFMGYYEGGHA